MPRLYVGDMEFGRCPYGGVEIDELVPGQFWVKVAGAWKRVIHIYFKIAGEWKEATVWKKRDGAWEKITA